MKIPDVVNQFVCSIWYLALEGGTVKYLLAGTGFFAAEQIRNALHAPAVYIVTARHVIEAALKGSLDQIVRIRVDSVNEQDSVFIARPAEDWKYAAENDVDVAATLINKDELSQMRYRAIPHSKIISEKMLREQSIGTGDEIFFSGFFSGYYGEVKNHPVICRGAIAAMPTEKVTVEGGKKMHAYLIDACSAEGMSGSPVFTIIKQGAMVIGKEPDSWTVALLGLLRGHWQVQESKGVYDHISFVVPGQKIADVIQLKESTAKSKK